MKTIAGFGIIVALLAIVAGCDGCNPPIGPEPSPKGVYAGKYIVSILSTEQTTEEFITWTFEDRFFHMNLDPDKFVGKCFCQCFGEYSLTGGVRLKVIESQPDELIDECTTCNAAENPHGEFVVDRSTDTLKLTRQVGDTLKQLLLTPITAEQGALLTISQAAGSGRQRVKQQLLTIYSSVYWAFPVSGRPKL